MPARNTVLWALVLFVLWVLLSGKLDALHLGMGAVVAAAVAMATRSLLALPPAIGPGVTEPVTQAIAGRFVSFVPWLILQIVISSLRVAWVVVHPRLPIDPRLVRLRAELPQPLARLTLATSITLTPGTVTLDVEGRDFLVHALTERSARGLAAGAEAPMVSRVRRIFARSERRIQ
ncbi:MAG TPA: Na+/H+ antiporter subunit E [Thermoanaerobaculia bacterium]|nr:Na+/H+ antiporter subunit E [Thermoanaerobaculia bacterium]